MRVRGSPGRGSPSVALAAATLLLAVTAEAHQVGLSRGDYAFAGGEVTAEIIFARGELASLVPDLDANGDGRLTPDEVDRARPELEAAIVAKTTVTADGARCAGKLAAAHLAEEDGLTVRGEFRCPGAAATAHVDLAFLGDLAHGHRHVARARGPSGEVEDVLFRGNSAFDLAAGAAPRAPAPTSTGAPAVGAASSGAASFVATGLARFFAEYLHVAFLVAALIVAATRRARVEVATAFAIGSTSGLALAALGIWRPDLRALGPAIAISVAYAGVAGLSAGDGRAPRSTTLAFGALHGFGLARALPAAAGASALAPYAVGALLGQLALVAAAIALFERAERAGATKRVAPRVACALVAIVGLAATARAFVA